MRRLFARRALFADARLAFARALCIAAAASALLGVLGRDLSWVWFGRSLRADGLRWAALVALSASSWWVSAPRRSQRASVLARLVLGLVAALAAIDVTSCFDALRCGQLHELTPVPFSAILAVLCAALAATSPRDPSRDGPPRGWFVALRRAVAVAGALATLVGAQIAGVAFTDYRRPADAIVVLGAGVYANGAPSEALAQRMATACDLYAGGYAPLLIVSGGPGRGGTTEPEVMRRLALECGVPDRAIVIDEQGVDTRGTASSAARIVHDRSLGTVLAVSHGYHLARVSLALRRAGVHALTVPARERRVLTRKPYYLARELAAYAIYAVAVTPA